MTERDITGDAKGSAYKRAQRVAKNLDLTDEDMRIIAEGVREFDAQRAVEHRTAQALEKIASNTVPDREKENSWAWEERRLRRREVYAQELMAVAILADDVHDEALDKIRETQAYQRLVERLTREPNASVPDSATP
jgi:hypothetical protein